MAYGIFAGVKDSVKVYDGGGRDVRVVEIRDGIFCSAAALGGPGAGLLKTFSVAAGGGITVLDTQQYVASCNPVNALVKMYDGIGVVVYYTTTFGSQPTLQSFSVDASGNISLLNSTTWNWNIISGTTQPIDAARVVDSTNIMVVTASTRHATLNQHYLAIRTIIVNSDGTFGNIIQTETDWLSGYKTSYVSTSVFHWTGNTYILNQFTNNTLYTITIYPGGTFSGAVDTKAAGWIHMRPYRLADGICLLTGQTGGDGWFWSFYLTDGGVFGATIDQQAWTPGANNYGVLGQLAEEVWMVVYAYGTAYVKAISWGISNAGIMDAALTDQLNIQNHSYLHQEIAHVADDIWVVAWTALDGTFQWWLTTIDVSTEPISITTLNPPSGGLGASGLSVVITGTGFVNIKDVDFGADITVNSYTVDSTTQITVSIDIDTAATLGTRDVTLESDHFRDTLTDGFEILGPTVLLANPSSAQGNTSTTVIVTGTVFTGATDVDFGSGITVDSFTVDSDVQISVDITIALLATAGYRDITVTSYGHAAVLTNGFLVLAATEDHYIVQLPDLGIPYVDEDGTKELHIALENLSPTSKSAGEDGQLVIEIGYEVAG